MQSGSLPVTGILGCGRMGSALAVRFAAGGYRVLLASRRAGVAAGLADRIPQARAGSAEWVARCSDVVVLAAPADVICTDLAPHIGPAAVGKTVIDISNPGLGACATSCAELIAKALPGSVVVKALNCVPARWLSTFGLEAPTVTIPIASDSETAKELVASILERVGFDVADAGPLRSSRWIESLAALLMQLSKTADLGDGVGFRLVRLHRQPLPLT